MATYIIGPFLCDGVDQSTISQSPTYGHEFAGRVVIDETVNASSNTSSISWSFQIYVVRDAYVTNLTATSGNAVTVTIDGTTVFSSPNIGTVAMNTHHASNPLTLASGTSTITHNSDGTKTLPVTAVYTKSSLSHLSRISVSGSVSLTRIARASAVDSVSSVNIGGSPTVKWTPASTSYSYDIKFSCGTWSYTTGRITVNSTDQQTFNTYAIPTEVANQITSAKSATATCTIKTYSTTSGSTSLGTSSATFTITVPNNNTYRPTANLAITATGAFNSYNLTNVTSFTYDCSGSSSTYGASISKYELTVKDSSGAIVASGGSATGKINPITSATTLTFSLTVTDSRGYKNASPVTETKVITAYNKPTIKSLTVTRGTGTVSSVTSCSNWQVNESGGGVAQVKYATEYTTLGTSNNLTCQILINGGSATTVAGGPNKTAYFNNNGSMYATDTSYTFTLKIYDTVSGSSNATTMSVVLSSARFPIDFMANAAGGAINSVADTSGALKLGWDLRMLYEPIEIYDASGNKRIVLDCDTGLQLLNTNGVRLAGTVRNTGLANGTDLNTITDIGMYNAGSNTLAASMVNCPTKKAFYLTVENIGNSANGWIRFQTIKDYDGEMYGRRAYKTTDNLTFSAWKKAAPIDATTDASFGTSSQTVSSVAWDITSIGQKRICAAAVTKTVNINYAWGNVYNGTSGATNANFPSINYPVTFATEPKCIVTLASSGTGGDGWVTTNGEYSPTGNEKLSKSPAYDVGRATSKSVTVTLNYLVIGNV